MTLTFVVESMAVANAVLRSRLLKVKHPEENANDSEGSPDEAGRASPTEALVTLLLFCFSSCLFKMSGKCRLFLVIVCIVVVSPIDPVDFLFLNSCWDDV